MSEEELFNRVKAVADTSEEKSFGVVMKAAVAAVNGAADGKRISAAVKKVLENR